MKVVAAFLVNTVCNFAIGLLVAKFLGPEEFGRFALAMAVGVVMQATLFEWLRYASSRFYSARVAAEEPELRATLDLAFALIAFFVGVLAIAVVLMGFAFPIPRALVGLAAALAIANGLFDYQASLVRARFDGDLYGRLILVKNLIALIVTAGGAFLFEIAEVALVGVCVSMVGSVLIASKSLRDRNATRDLARLARAAECFRYAAPIVCGSMLYLCIPLVNRALVARWDGLAETGHFSLAYDLGVRVVGAIGTALDVLLFQIAVQAGEAHGEEVAREQVAANIALVFAILAPTCAGVWLTLPSLEYLVVPAQFRGYFASYYTLLIGGFFAFGMINWAINPIFQIAKRTAPLIIAAVVACLADLVLILVLPKNGAHLAMAQSGAMLAGLLALMTITAVSGARWPRKRDIALVILATIAMIACVLQMRGWAPGVTTLLAQTLAGLAVYGVFVAAFDIAGLRTHMLRAARELRGAA